MKAPLTVAVTVAVAVAATATATAQDLPRGPMHKVTLREAISQALHRNQSVEVAAAEVRRAAALVEQVRAAALPTLTANGTYTRLQDNAPAAAQAFLPADQFTANATLAVPLLAGPQWAQWAQSRQRAQLATLNGVAVRRQVAIATAHAYLAIIAQRRVVDLNQRARDTAQAHYEYTRMRFTQGIGSKLDEVRAEQELRADEAQVESAQASLLRAQAALGVLLGEDRPVDAAGDPDLPPLPGYPDAATEAPRLRPDVRALDLSLRLSRRVVRESWLDYLPTLSAVAQPAYNYTSSPTLVLPQLAFQFQLLLSVPIYDGGRRYGLLHERRALRDEADATLRGGLRQAQVDIETGYATLRRAETALTSARAAADLARRAVDIATLSYRTGATTNLEVIDAERRARDADTTAVLAEDDLRQVHLDLLAAAGRFP